MVQTEEHCLQHSYSGQVEHDSRQTIPAQPRFADRMVSPSGDFNQICQRMHTPQIDLFAKTETTLVCVPSPRQGSLGSGRSEPILGGHGWLCLPFPLVMIVAE